jgi:hypothetical protein
MARYVLIPPAQSTKLPGIEDMQWTYVEFPASASKAEVRSQLGDFFGTEAAASFSMTEAPAGQYPALQASALQQKWVGTFGDAFSNLGNAAAKKWEEAFGYSHTWTPWDEVGNNSSSATNQQTWQEFDSKNPLDAALEDRVKQAEIDRLNQQQEAADVTSVAGFDVTSVAGFEEDYKFTEGDHARYKADMEEFYESEDVKKIVTDAVSSSTKPGVYKVHVTTLDGLKSVITVQANNRTEARSAAKGEADFEVGSKIGVVKEISPPAVATSSKAAGMLSQPSINIEQFLAGIPSDIKRVYSKNGVPLENPLISALVALSQTGIQSTTSLEIQRLASENAVAIAEFNKQAEIQIATERGASDIAIADIRAKADIDIARSQELATRFIASQQKITDKYVADVQAETSKDVAATQAAASGPYGFLGPMPEGGYTEEQLELLTSLIHAEQQGAIDAAAATEAIRVAQIEAEAATLQQQAAADTAQAAASGPFGFMQWAKTVEGQTPEQQLEAIYAKLNEVGLAQAGASNLAAQGNAFGFAAGQEEFDPNQIAQIANNTAAGLTGTATIQASQIQADASQAIAQIQATIGIDETQKAYLAAEINAEAQRAVAAIQAGAQQGAAQTQAGATTQAATTQADAQKQVATTQAEMQKEAQLAIQALQDSAAIDELVKAEAIATIQANAQSAGQVAQQQLRETTILGELEKAQAIATIQQEMQITAQAAMAGLQNNQALSELEKAQAIAQIQEDTRQSTNIALAEIQATAATTQAGATTTAASTQAKASSPYGYLAGGGQLTDVEAILSGQYNPFGQDSVDRLNLARAQASGGLTNEANILGVQQAAAATNPYAATQLGQDSGRIDQILRGGLTAEQQRQLVLAGQAGQMQGNYLNYISNPFAVGASQTLSGGTAAPFSQQQLQQVSDSPSGTVPSFSVGLNPSPFALPETQAIGGAQGLPANFTLGDWGGLSDVEQQSISGQLSPYGITPSMIGELAASYTPGSTQAVSSYT